MRNMSFAMTTQQMRDQTKTVTRRFGWWFLKPGDHVQPVEKGQGLKKGEKVKKIGPPIEIVCAWSFQLNLLTQAECEREGFPGMLPSEFVEMFCRHYGCRPLDRVNRILFRFCNERTEAPDVTDRQAD